MHSLPLESATLRELGAPTPGEVTLTDHLVAATVNAVRENTYVLTKANTKKGHHVARPKPIRLPRPGEEQTRRRPATPEELARALGGQGVVRYTPKGSG